MSTSHKPHNAIQGVAPAEAIRSDYESLHTNCVLRCANDVEQLLMIQSVEGHCHAGYGAFHGKTYPNTNMNDIASALRLDPELVKEDRQDIIDEISILVDRVARGEHVTWASNGEGEPLTRCGFLRHVEVDPVGLIQGLYIGGLRDEHGIRELANQRYGCNMGYGESYFINRSVMTNLGLDGYNLATRPHAQDIERYRREGLFADKNGPDTAYQYIRLRTGMGASDDLAIIFAGMMFGYSAAVGCYLADAVDTLEKYAGVHTDQDSEISAYIQRTIPNLGVTIDDAADLAYLCAIPDDMKNRLPDSSMRHLLEIDREIDQCALESHIAFTQDAPYSEMDLGHGECTNMELYEYAKKRLKSFSKIR